MDEWLKNNLVCSRDHNRLQRRGDYLICPEGHEYPIVNDVPVMLLEEATPTHDRYFNSTFNMVSSSRISSQSNQTSAPPQDRLTNEKDDIDPFVQEMVASTCGNLYKPLVKKLTCYPIPEIRLPQGTQEFLLDIGCNWGRWTISAAKKGYIPVGIDPNLEAIMAARRVSRQLKVSARFVVADARYLPFASSCFDVVYSFSVLQHFSKENVRLALNDVARVLKPQGTCLIQMPNKYGIKSLYNQVKGRFGEAVQFRIRYWTVPELRKTFTEVIGAASLSVDGYFGLGIQKSDIALLPRKYQLVVRASERLRLMSEKARWMKYFADSIYVKSIRDNKNHRKS